MTPTVKAPPGSKKQKQRKDRYDQGPPEHSVALRAMVCSMAVFCILISCTFVYTPRYTLMLYVVATIVGHYVSYQCRSQKNKLLSAVIVVGIVTVMLGVGRELFDCFYSPGVFDWRGPMVHMVAGTFAVHSFELRGRKAINQSALLGLVLICLVAPVAKNLYYGVCIAVYICLGSVMLYYECQSRSTQSWLAEPISNAPVLSTMAVDRERHRHPTGSAVVVLLLMPLFSAVAFAFLPRGEGMVDLMRAWSQQSIQQAFLHVPGWPAQHQENFSHDNYSPPTRAGKHPGASGPKTVAAAQARPKAAAERNSTGGQGAVSGASTRQQRIESEQSEKSFGIRAPHDKDQSQVVYRVWSDRSLFLRRFCYDTTDGIDWFSHEAKQRDQVPTDSRGTYDLSGLSTFTQPQRLASMTQQQQYEVATDVGQVLALGWIPQKISLDTRSIVADPYGQVRASTRLGPGTKYSVTSSVPMYDLKKMRADGPLDHLALEKIRHEMSNYLQIPDSHDNRVTEMAHQITGMDGANWFTKAERITNYLRSNYRYSMAEKPANQGNAINTFLLVEKVGDCRDFASALVILCRCLGIPARCVGGYAPGDFNVFLGCREVRLLHAHAWAEVYVPPYGWVPFDGIPEGAMPEPPKENGLDVFSQLRKHLPGANQNSISEGLAQIQKALVAVLSIIVSIIAGWLIYKRWKSWREYEMKVHPASKLYHQMLRDLKKLQVVKKESDTPQNVLERVTEACLDLEQKGKPRPELPDTVNQFIEVYSQCYFGDKSAKLPELQQLQEKVRELVAK